MTRIVRPPRPALVLAATAVAFAFVAVLAPAPARAHQSSQSWSRVQLRGDGAVDYTLLLSARDLYEALALERDREATDEEIRAGEARLFAYVLERVRVGAGEAPCPAEARGLRLVGAPDRRVELRFVARCPAPLARFVLDYRLFFDLDARHAGMLQVTHEGRTVTRELRKNQGRFEWALGAGAPTPASLGAVDFIEKGVEHIFTGYDHIAFVIGLLLVAAIRRKDGWRARGLRPGIAYLARVVTAFTVAHSLTLIAAALGLLELPTRLVEATIAASILYIAAENIVSGDPRNRWPLAFGFGLVHGLGFATMLRPLLPPRDVLVPLLAFNLGVELGQLAIVMTIFPLLHMLADRDAPGYRRTVVLGGSAVIGLLGLLWLAERTLDVALLSRVLG